MTTPLALIGYGKMGRLIEQLAPEYGFEVRARFGSGDIGKLSKESLMGVGTAIEFTNAKAAPDNLRRLAALGVNTVCGTTGWYEELATVRKEIAGADSALVYGPNFSIGVNL